MGGPVDVCVCVCVCVFTYTNTHTHTHTHTHTQTHPPFLFSPHSHARKYARTHARTHAQVWGALVRAINETSAYERRIVLGGEEAEWAAEDNGSVGPKASEASWFCLTAAPLTALLVRDSSLDSSRVPSRVPMVRS